MSHGLLMFMGCPHKCCSYMRLCCFMKTHEHISESEGFWVLGMLPFVPQHATQLQMAILWSTCQEDLSFCLVFTSEDVRDLEKTAEVSLPPDLEMRPGDLQVSFPHQFYIIQRTQKGKVGKRITGREHNWLDYGQDSWSDRVPLEILLPFLSLDNAIRVCGFNDKL